jgi:predicted DsbA family dithiol-disulfide isomerase
VDALCWSDYLCPWCYVGLDRSALLRSLGVRVTTLPFELHPGIPPEGLSRSPKPERWAAIAAECAEVGLAFDPQSRTPNTRRVLELSEWVRRTHPNAHGPFEAAVFLAHFGKRQAIDDVGVLDDLLRGVGVHPQEAWDVVAGGEPCAWVDASMAMAREAGVAGTPAWLLGDVETGLLVPGVQPRALFERIVGRLQSRTP